MKELLAHSAQSYRPAKGNLPARPACPVQPYQDHIKNGLGRVRDLFSTIKPYLQPDDYDQFRSIVEQAFEFHDLGKLCEYSQKILRGERKYWDKMPNHVDAGTAYLSTINPWSAWLTQAHHRGFKYFPSDLRNLRDQGTLGERCTWIRNVQSEMSMEEYTDSILSELLDRHRSCVSENTFKIAKRPKKESGLFLRLALSLLVSADHFDTARHYQNYTTETGLDLKAAKRLTALKNQVNTLKYDEIKHLVYQACSTEKAISVASCSSEVGTGKTLSMMSFALTQAKLKNLRRIFYIAPFTNIISQTVKVYRENLVLTGEKDYEVVAEHHHAVDYEDQDDNGENSHKRDYSASWFAPIVCTTAVQFFETLATCRTGRLKKLHSVIGSVILIDEAHGCIPAALWPLTLPWLQELSERFGCTILFASGSMVEPWSNPEIQKISKVRLPVQPILHSELSLRTQAIKSARIKIEYRPDPQSLDTFTSWVSEFSGSKLVVCNTIANAAQLVGHLDSLGINVLHLSTALTPYDRELVLIQIKKNLEDKLDWVLVATSCVDSGLDFSFQWGFREVNGLIPIRQFVGRVNRQGEFKNNSRAFVFRLNQEFNHNPTFNEAINIFEQLYQRGEIDSSFCKLAFDMEFERLKDGVEVNDRRVTFEDLIRKEKTLCLEHIAECYQVISDEKVTALIPQYKDFVHSTQDLSRYSVQVYPNDKLLEEHPVYPVQVWKGKYQGYTDDSKVALGWACEQ